MASKSSIELHSTYADVESYKSQKENKNDIAYKIICRPILEYASPFCCPYKSKHIKSIETINRKAYRWQTSRRNLTG